MVFHRSLSDIKSFLVSRSHVSIPDDSNSARVSILLPISSSPDFFPGPLKTVPSAPTTIGTSVTFMFPSFFFRSQVRSNYSLSFIFTLWSAWAAKDDIHFFSTLSGIMTGIRWSVCISKFQRILCVFFFFKDFPFMLLLFLSLVTLKSLHVLFSTLHNNLLITCNNPTYLFCYNRVLVINTNGNIITL